MPDQPPTSAHDNCPNCTGSLRSSRTPFTGPTSALDNYSDVETELHELGVISDTNPHNDSSDNTETCTYIVEAIVCTEITCTECDFSERKWHNVDDLADDLADKLMGNTPEDGIDSEALLNEFQ